jgi:perosamine synthetase
MKVPYFRPHITQDEIDAVVACLQSGWLTTGPKTKEFEQKFSAYVGSEHAVALNSATAALHLALEAIGLKRGEAVLVPTMTFAATAEVVRYFDAKPLLIDCRDDDFNLDLGDARRQAESAVQRGEKLRAIIPVHYGGQAVDMPGVLTLAREYGLKIVEDAAHCCPASYREGPSAPWRKVGSESDVCCYSFYANKCITTGEGGMACTNDEALADRMRIMSLHGISKDAWKRFTDEGSWYYEIVAPGFKYNLTDIAAAMGLQQLRKADGFRAERAGVAARFHALLGDGAELILPFENTDRIHSWHLFVVRLRLDRIHLDRKQVIEELKLRGIGTSVHWTPLHMHPYYQQTYDLKREDFPVAARISQEIISLPIYPGMTESEIQYVAETLLAILAAHRR